VIVECDACLAMVERDDAVWMDECGWVCPKCRGEK
jgi:hypothetical protein